MINYELYIYIFFFICILVWTRLFVYAVYAFCDVCLLSSAMELVLVLLLGNSLFASCESASA